jgi:hypothetical protein
VKKECSSLSPSWISAECLHPSRKKHELKEEQLKEKGARSRISWLTLWASRGSKKKGDKSTLQQKDVPLKLKKTLPKINPRSVEKKQSTEQKLLRSDGDPSWTEKPSQRKQKSNSDRSLKQEIRSTGPPKQRR